MIWVIHRAKSELAAALLDSIDVDEKLLIEVDVQLRAGMKKNQSIIKKKYLELKWAGNWKEFLTEWKQKHLFYDQYYKVNLLAQNIATV